MDAARADGAVALAPGGGHHRNYLGYGLPQADLIQEGNIGLMKAVRRFDPERGVRLVSFALHWISAEIHEHILRNWRLVKIATTKAQRKLFFNLRSMKTALGGADPRGSDAIAKTLSVKPEEVLEMETRLTGQESRSTRRRETRTSTTYRRSPTSRIRRRAGTILERSKPRERRSEGLQRALGSSTPAAAHHRGALAAEEDDPATLAGACRQYGVSAERIRQIEARR